MYFVENRKHTDVGQGVKTIIFLRKFDKVFKFKWFYLQIFMCDCNNQYFLIKYAYIHIECVCAN